MTRDEFYESLLNEYDKWYASGELVCTHHSRPAGITVFAASIKTLMPLIDRYVAERENAVRSELADQFYVASGVEATEFDVAGKPWTPVDLVAAIREQVRNRRQKNTQSHRDALKERKP